MDYKTLARNMALDFFKSADELDMAFIDVRAKLKAERITRKVADEQTANVSAKKEALTKDFVAKLDRLKAEQAVAVDKWAEVGVDRVHDDAKLFSGTFSLTGDDLTALSTKHRENFTMQKAIRSYADKRGVAYDSATPLPGQKKEAFASLCEALAESARSGGIRRGFIEDTKQFSQIAGKHLDDHGEYASPEEIEQKAAESKTEELADKIAAIWAGRNASHG